MNKSPFKPHPIIAMPTDEQIQALIQQHGDDTPRILHEIEERRLDLMEKMEHDRFNHGYVLPCWKRAAAELENPGMTLLCLFGGNGAGKTVFSIWYAMKMMVEHPNAKVLVLHESESSSNRTHQEFMYDYLPKEWKPTETRRVKKTLTTKINYSRADGFTNNILTLPNGSLAQFGFYGQNVGDYEGGGWNLIVADENLPLEWLKTLLFRLPRRGGKMIWTFTPVHGITQAVKHVVDGARTVEHRRAELLPETHVANEMQDWPPGQMPVVQRAVDSTIRIHYFFSEENPFAGYAMMALASSKLSTLEIEKRYYGYARNTLRAKFPLFGAAHIVPPEKVPTKDVTRYHVMDPAGARNMFQIWGAVDPLGRIFIYREWPDQESLGEWAVLAEKSRLFDGEPGPAQPSLGYGTSEYKRLILQAEGNLYDSKTGWALTGEDIFQRIIDPRSGRAESMSANEGSSSIIDRFLEEQTGEGGIITEPSLSFEPASGQHMKHGHMAINDLLAYNPREPVTALLNEPRLFISERCQNLIWCMRNYTGNDGEKAASKDPVDCLRYLVLENPEYVGADAMKGFAGGSY